MKRIVIVTLLLLLLLQGTSLAQERPPLAMRIVFEWTVLGAVVGAATGVALWLTDPGNPNFSVSRSAIEGAGWGVVAGAGFGVFVMQRTAIFPSRFALAPSPLAPSRRITDDPVRAQAESEDLLSLARTARRHPAAIALPILNIRF